MPRRANMRLLCDDTGYQLRTQTFFASLKDTRLSKELRPTEAEGTVTSRHQLAWPDFADGPWLY